MKFRNILFIAFIIVVIIAVFTRPSREDFTEYLTQKQSLPLPQQIQQTNGFAFSVFSASYFDAKAASNSTAPFKNGTWLGLFGKFWKL